MQFRTSRRWRRFGALLSVTAITAVAAPGAATADVVTPAEITTATNAGAAWIADQQDKTTAGATNTNPTGGLPGFNGNWAIMSLAAAGIHAADVHKPGVPRSLQDYLATTYTGAKTFTARPSTQVAGDHAREAMIAVAAGIDPNRLSATGSVTASLASRWNPTSGSFGTFAVNSDGFALLAEEVLHLPRGVREKLLVHLLAAQKTIDGGWQFGGGPVGNGDIDMTGAALSMLCQSGRSVGDLAIDRGVAFLHGKLNPATGGFGLVTTFGIPPSNAPGSAWAVTGLRECGVDLQSPTWTTPSDKNPLRFLLDLQRPNGSFKYIPTSAASAPGTDMNSAEVAVRALAGKGWRSVVPARVNAGDPRTRSLPVVTDGTPVSVALSVDDRAGDVRFCAVEVPAGGTLADLLNAAATASVPTACVTDPRTSDGTVSALNGHTASATQRWEVQIDGGAPQVAADQRIGFGDVVSLELVDLPLLPATASTTFGTQAQGTIGSAQTVTYTAMQDGVEPTRAVLGGADAEDFVVAADTCSGETLNRGEECVLRVRFAPSVAGNRSATVRLQAGRALVGASVALTGTGGALPQGPAGADGTSGADGTNGTAGTNGLNGADGRDGATGPQGAVGPQGPAGPVGPQGASTVVAGTKTTRTAKATVVCRFASGRTKLRCTVRTTNGASVKTRASVRLLGTKRSVVRTSGRSFTVTLSAKQRLTTKSRAVVRVSNGNGAHSVTVRPGVARTVTLKAPKKAKNKR